MNAAAFLASECAAMTSVLLLLAMAQVTGQPLEFEAKPAPVGFVLRGAGGPWFGNDANWVEAFGTGTLREEAEALRERTRHLQALSRATLIGVVATVASQVLLGVLAFTGNLTSEQVSIGLAIGVPLVIGASVSLFVVEGLLRRVPEDVAALVARSAASQPP